MHDKQPAGLIDAELAGQEAVALPDKEVVSILDLNADLDLAIDAAAPIDLAVAANANVAAPIDAAVGANILYTGSTAQALADQGVIIDQGITADATARRRQGTGSGITSALFAPLRPRAVSVLVSVRFGSAWLEEVRNTLDERKWDPCEPP